MPHGRKAVGVNMAGKKGFSVDEYLAGYSKAKKKGTGISELMEDSRREKEQRKAEAVERREEAAGIEREKEEAAPKIYVKAPEEGGKETIRSKAVAVISYALRALAISVMALLMLFLIEKRVPGSERVEWLPPVAGTYLEFALANIILLLGLFCALLGPQLVYYIVYWVAHRKWKAFAREEIVYSVLFSLVGLIGSAAILLALGY